MNPSKFHPSQRAWPSGMPESIKETTYRDIVETRDSLRAKKTLNLVHVYCPNTGCDWHVRVDEKVKDYNLNGHLLNCEALTKVQRERFRLYGRTEPQEAVSREDSPGSDGFSRTQNEALRTAPMDLGYKIGPGPKDEKCCGGWSGFGMCTDCPTLSNEPKQPTILEEAGELVDGPREAHYGHPYDDFSRVIGAFNALFENYLSQPLEVRHWPLIMQLCKLSREIHEHKRDNLVDGAGYWRTLEKVVERDRGTEN